MMMNRKQPLIQFLATIVLLTLFVLPAQAQGDVSVVFTAGESELTVGDPVKLTLEVKHPAGYQVIIPKLEQTWGDFEVRSQSQPETIPNDDGTETTRETIEVTLFAPGSFQTPGLPITIGDTAGKTTEQMTPPVSLTVISVLTEEDTELRDIKPQAPLDLPPVWPWVLAGLLVAALLTGVGWLVYRRLLAKGQLAPALVVNNRPPYQAAYDELTRIEGLRLMEQERPKEHYTLVTDCLRRYLERQLSVRAFDRTTWELKLAVRDSDIAPEHVRRFLDLFMESDLVKFARFFPETGVARQFIIKARTMVDLTRPVPEVETPAARATSISDHRVDQRPGQSERNVEVIA